MKENILEVCRVTPPSSSPADDIFLPLTFFDLFNIIFPPVEHLFFYETPHQPHHTILSKLKHSLSLTLRKFLPAAGYLVWPHSSPNPIIRYKNGDGVLLTVIESDADFNSLSGKTIHEATIFQPLIAHIVRLGDQVPLIAFKITIFPNKGICIGVTVHHSLFDLTSTTLLMTSWASLFKFGNNKDSIPIFERKFIRERYPNLENSCLKVLKQNGITSTKTWLISAPKRSLGILRGTFVLSSSNVGKLKELVRGQLENNKKVPHVSTFAIAYAYVINCLVKVKPPKNNTVNVSFGFECRSRLEPLLPKTYFGNCVGQGRPWHKPGNGNDRAGTSVGTCDTYFTADELLRKDGMARIVNFISNSIKPLNSDGVLKEAENWLTNMFKSVADTETMRVFVVGSSRFEYQSIDFGWGRPRKSYIASIDGTGGVSFTQGGDENKGGIEVELSLNECEMEKFAYLFDQGRRDMDKRRNASL